MHPIYALWCHPRSLSTAIERIMRERGDLHVMHEPFLYTYYSGASGRPLPHLEPGPDCHSSYEAVRDDIRARARSGPVFFKDMSYYVLDRLTKDPEFLTEMTHGFLVRDPAAAILSYARLDPDFRCEEAGLEASWTLYCRLRDIGLDPPVMQAEAVQERPQAVLAAYWQAVGLPDAPGAFTWKGDIPDDWRHVAGWHRSVARSRGIRPPERGSDPRAELRGLGGGFLDTYRHHRPFYDRLVARAIA
ncbi:MAG: hypothetical protein OXL68_19475 [Paracoccaceae bacterium]|nr:hypothetical protein [Paracoccaceae bacterium]